MNVMQAFLAAVQCKLLPKRKNRNLRGTAAGSGGTNSGTRNISGLSGTPSSYSGRHTSGKANRSGHESHVLGTRPSSEKKISFAEDSIFGVSMTHRSRLPGSILKSHHAASSLSKSPELKLAADGSECISQSAGTWALEQEKAEKDTILHVTEPPKESEVLGVEKVDGNEYNEDEVTGRVIEQEEAEEDTALHVTEPPKEIEASGGKKADGSEDNEDEELGCSL